MFMDSLQLTLPSLSVQSATTRRDMTPSATVHQFEVTFYSPNGKKIKVVRTTEDEVTPRGVVLEIEVCTEATTGES